MPPKNARPNKQPGYRLKACPKVLRLEPYFERFSDRFLAAPAPALNLDFLCNLQKREPLLGREC